MVQRLYSVADSAAAASEGITMVATQGPDELSPMVKSGSFHCRLTFGAVFVADVFLILNGRTTVVPSGWSP